MKSVLSFPKVDSPNPELLRRHGWSVKAAHGSYCVVWRGSQEVVMVWRDGTWQRANGGAIRTAA
ncbi:hypothetical protein [Limnoglobus roseus]|uniref:Uncharacterized protein n=1 Tax=Limnoglobus roseus TaxID=2598579 RepID=A0A5C1A4L3_9BACT|nr:hypothetical protein [Limnoglobus roseus]QEL13337.1 hypothetical protein PX52LOC_00191 [Limnoglobus roseus]